MTMHNLGDSPSTPHPLWALLLLTLALVAPPTAAAQAGADALVGVVRADLAVATPEAQMPRTSTLIVSITGVSSSDGRVGCALYGSAAGFPMDRSRAQRAQEVPARRSGVTCRFENIPAGTYALAVAHDENGNGRTDRNLIGLPTEAWGVSNGVRPRMRAPRFNEAAFTIGDGVTTRLSITLG